jgi:hypothetical protein
MGFVHLVVVLLVHHRREARQRSCEEPEVDQVQEGAVDDVALIS